MYQCGWKSGCVVLILQIIATQETQCLHVQNHRACLDITLTLTLNGNHLAPNIFTKDELYKSIKNTEELAAYKSENSDATHQITTFILLPGGSRLWPLLKRN